MKRKLSIFLASMLVLTGCNNGPVEIDSNVDENEVVDLEFLVWGDVAMNQKIADDFHKLYPNWTVTVDMPAGSYYDTLQMYSGADIMPDIFYMSSSLFIDYAKEGSLLNLQPYLDNGTNLKESDLWEQNSNFRFNDETSIIDKENGDLYGFIKDISPDYSMIYNKGHIDEYNSTHEKSLAEEVGYPTDPSGIYPSETKPMTWEQNLKFCSLLTKFDKSGNISRYGCSWIFEPWTHLQQMVLQQGETLFDSEGYFKNTEALSKSLECMASYMDVNSEYRSSALVGYAGAGTVGDGPGFKNGEISVIWNARCAITAYDFEHADFELGVAPSPMPYESEYSTMVASGVGLCLSGSCERPGVAYKFLEYFMTYGQKYISSIGYNIPGNKTIASTDYLNVEDEYINRLNNLYYSYMEHTEIMETNPYLDNTTIWNCYSTNFPKIWSNNSDKINVSTAISSAAEMIRKKVDQNKARL